MELPEILKRGEDSYVGEVRDLESFLRGAVAGLYTHQVYRRFVESRNVISQVCKSGQMKISARLPWAVLSRSSKNLSQKGYP